MDEGAAKQRNEETVAPRRLEAEHADARVAARRDIFPDAHTDQQQENGGEEGRGRPCPGHPGEIEAHETAPAYRSALPLTCLPASSPREGQGEERSGAV